MSKVTIGCPICIAAGIDESKATMAVHFSNDPKFEKNHRKTGRCMRSNHHPHGGPVDYYLDTGELVKNVERSPYEFLLYQAPDPPSIWGIEAAILKTFGVLGLSIELADDFRLKFPDLGKKMPSRKILAMHKDSNVEIDMYPLYNETDIIGIEIRVEAPKTSLRPGEYGPTSNGKEVKIIGESGLFISTPYPKLTPEFIVIFEGAKDACIAAADNFEGDLPTVVFCGCSANFKQDLVAKTLHLRFPGAILISIGDRDKAGTGFQAKALKLGAIPQSLRGCKGKDLGGEPDQYLRTEAVKEAVSAGVAEWRRLQEARPSDLSVMDQLQKEGLTKSDANGIPQATNRTITLSRILDLDPKLSNLRRNLMGMRDYHDGIEINDEHVVLIQNDIDKRYGIICSIDQLERQIALKCSINAYHPVRDYFDALPKWDGKDRYPLILERVISASLTPLNLAYISIFHRGAVARIYAPGCKHDTIIIFKSSRQGVGKTSYPYICTVNISGAFVEGHEDVMSKDGLLIMHGAWIIELGEIDRITSKKDAELLKNFLSRRIDQIRPPYGRRIIDKARMFVTFGTTNKSNILMDTTGNRRFHVIETGDNHFDLDILRSNIDQIWAQAIAEYKDGMPWWLDSKLENDHQQEMESFQAEEPWTVLIDKALTEIKRDRNKIKEELSEGVTIAEILIQMGIKAESQNRGQANRASEILRNMGWSKLEHQVRRGNKRLRLWFPPQDEMLEEMVETGVETGVQSNLFAVFREVS